MIDEELDLLKTYINLGYKIEQLERYRRAISDNYYKSHSLIGGFDLGDNGEVYQRSLSPFIVAWEITESEKHAMDRLERLTFRYRHFTVFCDTLDVEQVKRLETFKNDEINEVQKIALDEIQEIEEATAWKFFDGVMIDAIDPLDTTANDTHADILTAIELLQGDLFTC